MADPITRKFEVLYGELPVGEFFFEDDGSDPPDGWADMINAAGTSTTFTIESNGDTYTGCRIMEVYDEDQD